MSEVPYVTPALLRLREFSEDSLRRISVGYLVWLFVAMCLSFLIYKVSRGNTAFALFPSQVIYYLILSVHLVYRYKKLGSSFILAPDVCFAMFFTIIHLGYMSLYTAGIVPFSEEAIYFEQANQKALFAINVGLIGFLFGFEIRLSQGRNDHSPLMVYLPSHGWGMMGISLIATGLLMHLVGLYTLGFYLISNYGYAAIAGAYRFGASYFTIICLNISILVIAAGIMVYLVYSSLLYGKLFQSKLALFLVVISFMIVILEGDRGPILRFGLPILLVRHFLIKRIRFRYLLIIGLLTMFLFTALAVVRTTVFKPAQMMQEYQYQRAELQWYSAIVELGGSFNTLNVTVHEVPHNEPYWKGASWRDSIVHIVPFLQGFAVRRGFAHPSPSKWVTDTYWGPERAGRGFSVTAEGFLNFGFPGVFAELMICGIFLRWLMAFFSLKPSACRALILFGCFALVVLVIRNHFNLLWAAAVNIMVLSWILNLLFGNQAVLALDSNSNILGDE
jgi:hypothetical protein